MQSTTTKDILRDIAKRHNTTNDSALAQLLRVSRATVSRYRAGSRSIDATTALRVAHLLDADPLAVIAAVELERATTDEQRKAWSEFVATAHFHRC